MDKVKLLLMRYLDGELSSGDFVNQYLKLVGELRDENWQALNENPQVNEKLDRLFKQHSQGEISSQTCEEEWERLIAQIDRTTVLPYSRGDDILSHLFVEADAYREDVEDRVEGLNIGDSELLVVTRKTLDALSDTDVNKCMWV